MSEHLDLAKNHIKRHSAPSPLTSNQRENISSRALSTRFTSVFFHILQTTEKLPTQKRTRMAETRIICTLSNEEDCFPMLNNTGQHWLSGKDKCIQGERSHENTKLTRELKKFVYMVHSAFETCYHLHIILRLIIRLYNAFYFDF